jgi:type IV pilus assembly protein PilB
MEDLKLVKALIDAKLLTSEAGEKIIKDAATLKKDAETLIYQRNLVKEEEAAKVKSRLLSVPYKKIDAAQILPELLKVIPADTANTYKIFPISRENNLLIVGMVHPDSVAAQEALKFIAKQLKVSLGIYLVTPSDAELVLRKYSPFADEIQLALRQLTLRGGEGSPFQKTIRLEEARTVVAEEAPIIKIVASILREAININASDIHMEPERKRLRIRFRIDGELREASSLPIEIHQPVVSRVKVLSDLKIDETRIPQDGRFRTIIFDREIDFRVSTFPTPFGEKAAIRVLDPAVGLKGMEDLGLTGRNSDIFQEGIQKPYGMVLITGPTGSGKTTTLYAAMQILNKENVNIVSLEDPVEYSISGVNQSQVKPEIGYDFASGLRQILRQDPDVIMVGEIRDNETAALAVHAALTGHIVLSTLHTNNAIGVIPRLIDMRIPPFLLPSSLNLMAAQRLISRLCQNCRKAEEAPSSITAVIKQELEKLPADLKVKFREPYKIYRSAGCSVCKNKGTVGRIALFEIFKMTPELADIISAGVSENKLLEEARRQGMISLRQDGILKALDGLVLIEEILRETEGV